MNVLEFSSPDLNAGEFCLSLAKRLFPICRSITGPGVRETLAILKEHLPDLQIQSVKSGSQAFDWTVPAEWAIREAFISDEAGNKIVDFKNHNLHVVGYSEPFDRWLSLSELNEHLYSLPDQPEAIPYVTSYYKRRWGFCLPHRQRQKLKEGRYRAYIDSDLKPGVLNYGELVLPGESKEEIFLSTYVCHPSMANNELSGPVVTTALAKHLYRQRRKYTYRIVFIPETIGSLVYLSQNLAHLKKNVIAGFVISCIGDERCFSYLPSRAGTTLSDKVATHVLSHMDKNFVRRTWSHRGSDERQYCAPGVDLPMATISRSIYGTYPEYHTSLDDFSLVTAKGLQGGFSALLRALEIIENERNPKVTVIGEPQLGKRGLYPTLSSKDSALQVRTMMDVISYADGNHSLLGIAELVGAPAAEVAAILDKLEENGLITY